MIDQQPFADVVIEGESFSIPELKWRELLFIGALRADGELFVRDPSRPLAPFAVPDLFPDAARFRARHVSGRVLIERIYSGSRPG